MFHSEKVFMGKSGILESSIPQKLDVPAFGFAQYDFAQCPVCPVCVPAPPGVFLPVYVFFLVRG